jgi:hypothetical protein
MLKINIGRNDMLGKASSKEAARVDWNATECEYARQLQKAFGGREITVAFSDVSPAEPISGDYTDSYDVQCVMNDVWDRQRFWKYK